MSITHREGPFVAEITGDLLSVRRCQTEEQWGVEFVTPTGNGISMLFFCSLRQMPWFVVHSDGLYAQNAHDALTPLYRGEDAGQLLNCITTLLTTVESKRIDRGQFRKLGFTATLACLAGILLVGSSIAFHLFTTPDPRLLTTVDTRTVFGPPLPARSVPAEPDVRTVMPSRENDVGADHPLRPQPRPQPQMPAAAIPADGWDLPLSVRAELPAKLHSAASRGLFTVPLSSGHARTIYVFADPACPNCQRMERHFETAAGAVNVVIFPVTIEGLDASLNALTPVMALPEDERPAAWKRLFAADTGIGVPGTAQAAPAVADEQQAEIARGAIGVNEVAFRAYRLPGTPWTISDDGRYVPQSVLSSPAALMAFLNEGDRDGK
ncbi:TPA: thioredoxin fold domain-containing protein [Serratia marcescens]|nr:thioredoxin fold domain-containing protein [Serratia marcescens]